jgi:hypothetical protein
VKSDLTRKGRVRSLVTYADVVARAWRRHVAGGEGPDPSAASNHVSPDASGYKTEAQGALWKRPDSVARASGRGAEEHPVNCWLRTHGRDLTRHGSVMLVSGVFDLLVTIGALS